MNVFSKVLSENQGLAHESLHVLAVTSLLIFRRCWCSTLAVVGEEHTTTAVKNPSPKTTYTIAALEGKIASTTFE